MNIKRMIPYGKVDCYRYVAIALLAVLPLVSYSEERLMQPIEEVLLEEIAPVWLDKSATDSTRQEPVEAIKEAVQKPLAVQAQAFAVRAPTQRTIQGTVVQPKTTVSNNVDHQSLTEQKNPPTGSLPADFSIDSLLKAAQQGNVEAQYQLGMRYQYGDDVTLDLNKANQWLAKAARSGDARSQHALAMFYQQYATNVEGAKKALLWEKKAADRGSADAQYALGVMFKNGRLVRKNEAEARKWLAMAAQQGHLSAQLVLQE